jgi:type II secretory pathway component PulF
MSTQPPRSPVAALVWGVVVPILLWACLCASLILVVPGYKRMFMDFGMRLPAGAEAVIDVSDWVANYWYILVLSIPFLFAPDVAIVLLLWHSGRRTLVRLWAGLMIALPIVLGVLVAMSICLTWTKLNEGLSK